MPWSIQRTTYPRMLWQLLSSSRGQAVYTSIDNPNDVTVTHDFSSADKARAFASSPDLKTAMERAGVKGAPQIWFTTRTRRRS